MKTNLEPKPAKAMELSISKLQKLIAFLGNVEVDVTQWVLSFKASLFLTIPVGIYISEVFNMPVIMFSLFVFAALFVDMLMGVILNVHVKQQPFDKRKLFKTALDFLITLAVIVLFSMLTFALNAFENKYPESVAKVIDWGASGLFIILMSVLGLSLLAGVAEKGASMKITGFAMLSRILGVKLKKLEDQ